MQCRKLCSPFPITRLHFSCFSLCIGISKSVLRCSRNTENLVVRNQAPPGNILLPCMASRYRPGILHVPRYGHSDPDSNSCSRISALVFRIKKVYYPNFGLSFKSSICHRNYGQFENKYQIALGEYSAFILYRIEIA